MITKEWKLSFESTARDFAGEEATLTVCALLSAILRSSMSLGTGGDADPAENDAVFQVNHCHVEVPGPGESVVTKDKERIWFQARVMDMTGAVHIGVREKAALALAEVSTKAEFERAHANGDLVFPALSSVRIHVRLRHSRDGSDSQGGAEEPALAKELTGVLVEAEEQDLAKMPTQAILDLKPLLRPLSLSTQEFRVARFAEIQSKAHVGMVIDNQRCELVLVLAAATEKSQFQKFGDGYRLVTKNIVDGVCVPEGSQSERTVPQNPYTLVSICTEQNLTNYKLGPQRKGGLQYALVVVSGMREEAATGAEEPSCKTFMVERIQLLDTEAVEPCKKLLGKLAFARSDMVFEGSKRDRTAWSSETGTPSSKGKKVRRLSESPTDVSLPGARPASAS